MVGQSRRRLGFGIVLLLILLLLFEGVSAVGVRVLGGMGFIWSPESASDYPTYLAERDPVLGWPRPGSYGEGELSASGTRVDPGMGDTAAPCVAVYGDSFTWGDEVGPADAYPAVLGTLLGCRVANFGTPGYGSDQAFLRYRESSEHAAPVAVLGHYSENIIRNVNRYRGFMSNGGFGFKPRFKFEGGRLALLPIPTLSTAEFERLGDAAVLPDEYFTPGGGAGIVESKFPFTWTLLRSLGHYRFRARLAGAPSYAEFYGADHASGALDVTEAILLEFVRLAQERGQVPILLLIPDEKDLIEVQAGRPLPYAPLLERLVDAGIRVPDVAGAAIEALGDREPCALYTRCGGAHFNPEGYALVAQSLQPVIREAIERAQRTRPEAN